MEPKDRKPRVLHPHLPLDGEDRRALAALGSYALLAAGVLGSLLVLSVVLALCVRVFLLVSGVGS
jgi:hypothetical protein